MENQIEKEDLHRNLKIFAKTSFIVLISIIISKILTYVYRIIIARGFGPGAYGLFSLAIIIAGLFGAFASLGLAEGVLRYASIFRGKKEISKIRYILKSSVILCTFTSIFSGILLFLLSGFISLTFFHDSNLTIFLKIASALIPLIAFSNISLIILRAYERIGMFSFVMNILQNIVKVISLLFLIYLGFKSASAIFSYVLGMLSIPIASYLYCKYKLPEIFGRVRLKSIVKKKIFVELFSYSWPIMFFSIIANIFYWADSLLVGYFKGTAPVGIYNAAVPIALLLGVVQEIFMYLFFPVVTREFSKKKFRLIKELSQQTGKWIFTLGLPLLIFLILFPGAFINIIFGGQYSVAANSLRFLAISAFISSFLVISQNLLLMYLKSRLILIDLLLSSVLNIFLDILLINKPTIFFLDNSLGIVGAALATMISVIFLNLLFYFQAKHYLSITPLKKRMIKIFLVSLIPTALLIFVRRFIPINAFTIILQTILFFLLYLFLILITKCFDKNDIFILKEIKNKFLKRFL